MPFQQSLNSLEIFLEYSKRTSAGDWYTFSIPISNDDRYLKFWIPLSWVAKTWCTSFNCCALHSLNCLIYWFVWEWRQTPFGIYILKYTYPHPHRIDNDAIAALHPLRMAKKRAIVRLCSSDWWIYEMQRWNWRYRSADSIDCAEWKMQLCGPRFCDNILISAKISMDFYGLATISSLLLLVVDALSHKRRKTFRYIDLFP